MTIKTTSKNITIRLGLNDKDSKKQEVTTLDAYKIVNNLLVRTFWIWTISESFWIYTHENWEVVQEKTLVIDLYTDKDYYDFVEELKILFNQESVMVLIQDKPRVEFL